MSILLFVCTEIVNEIFLMMLLISFKVGVNLVCKQCCQFHLWQIWNTWLDALLLTHFQSIHQVFILLDYLTHCTWINHCNSMSLYPRTWPLQFEKENWITMASMIKKNLDLPPYHLRSSVQTPSRHQAPIQTVGPERRTSVKNHNHEHHLAMIYQLMAKVL